MDAGERQLHLGLHAGNASDATAGRGLGGVVEEGGLADPRLAAEHQHAAPPLVDAAEQPAENVALRAAVAHSLPAQRTRPQRHAPQRRTAADVDICDPDQGRRNDVARRMAGVRPRRPAARYGRMSSGATSRTCWAKDHWWPSGSSAP